MRVGNKIKRNNIMNKSEIEKLMLSSMKEGKKYEVTVYRLVKAEFIKSEKERGIEPDEAKCNAIIYKMIDQRNDSIEQYIAGNRKDLADIEAAEIMVLKTLVPQLPTEEEIDKTINNVIDSYVEENGVGALKDGKVMKIILDACAKELPNVPKLGKYVSKAVRDRK